MRASRRAGGKRRNVGRQRTGTNRSSGALVLPVVLLLGGLLRLLRRLGRLLLAGRPLRVLVIGHGVCRDDRGTSPGDAEI